MRIRVAVVGLGKAAREQYLPALQAHPRFEVVAGVDPIPRDLSIPVFPDLQQALASVEKVDAVVILTPSNTRMPIAVRAMESGCHVLLEKPPVPTAAELSTLHNLALSRGLTLFSAWQGRFGSQMAVAREWLRDLNVLGCDVAWHEDVERWHPNQTWIWEAGNFGVLDPGINALAILTDLLDTNLRICDAECTYPDGSATPIAVLAELEPADASYRILMSMDWRLQGREAWEISIETDAGTIVISDGAEQVSLPSRTEPSIKKADKVEIGGQYQRILDRFAVLIDQGACDVDPVPLKLAELLLNGAQRRVA